MDDASYIIRILEAKSNMYAYLLKKDFASLLRLSNVIMSLLYYILQIMNLVFELDNLLNKS